MAKPTKDGSRSTALRRDVRMGHAAHRGSSGSRSAARKGAAAQRPASLPDPRRSAEGEDGQGSRRRGERRRSGRSSRRRGARRLMAAALPGGRGGGREGDLRHWLLSPLPHVLGGSLLKARRRGGWSALVLGRKRPPVAVRLGRFLKLTWAPPARRFAVEPVGSCKPHLQVKMPILIE